MEITTKYTKAIVELDTAINPAVEQYRAKDAIFTPSNVISMMRAVMVVPAVLAFVLHPKLPNFLAASIFVIAFISDLLDGMLARRLDSISEFGKVIDPLADKIFVGVVVITMAIYGIIPFWFLAIIIARDLIIVTAGIYAKRKLGVVLPSNYPGKAAVLTISVTIFLIVCGVSGELIVVLEYLSIALMIVSLFLYGNRLSGLLAAVRTH